LICKRKGLLAMYTHQRLLSGLALGVALPALLVITFARPARAQSAAGAPD